MAESSREEIAKLEALYAGNPGGRVFVHLAEAYRKAGEHERARRILDEGLGRHVDSASGHVVLGRVLADMQLTGEAEAAFRRVLELDGGNLVALRWLGDLARQSGRNVEAAAHYRDLLIRNPSNEEVRDLVEIVEREEVSPAPPGLDTGEEYPEESPDWSADAGDTAVSGPIGDAEEPAVDAPSSVEGTAPDVTAWSAAPGDTGDTSEAEVEFGLVEIDGLAAEAEETPSHATSSGDPGREDESEFVAPLDDDDADLLELDELRRDDEAEPMEIHLLDPSYEPSDDDEEYAGELDLSDLEAAGSFEDDVEYADDSFIADLSAAGQDEPPEDELASGVDLISDGSALTLLPDDGEATPGEAGPAAPSIEDEVSVPSWGESRNESAGQATEYADEAADEAAVDEMAGDFEISDAGVADAEKGLEFYAGTEDVMPDSDSAVQGLDAGQEEDYGESVEVESEMPGLTTLGELSGTAERATEAESAPGPAAEAAAPEPSAEAEPAPEPETEAEPVSERTPGTSRLAEPAAAAEPAVERDIGLVTETMAVLYRSQGFHERAADVYRALLRARPGDERLSARLREAEEASRPAAAPAADEGDDAGEDAGEVWLRGVATAWSAGDAAADASPYAWTADAEDVDEAEAGEPIGSYLNDLVTWKAGSRRWMEQQSEPAPDTADAGGDVDLPDWLNDPAGAEPWTPDSPPADAGAVSAEDAGWSPAESVAESDPWDVTDEPAAEAARWAVPDEAGSDADPWGPAESVGATDRWDVPGGPVDATRALESQMEARSHADEPEADAAPFASDTSSLAEAPEDSGAGWTPLDLDRDVPAAATPVEPLPTLPEPQGSDEDSGEDEDLEMFRSWLQSLKK